MLRILVFLGTNVAVLAMLAVLMQVLGLEGWLQANGVHLNVEALLLVSAVVGMSGSFISLLLSKTMARAAVGARVIDRPRTELEQWLVTTVALLARKARIGMPEVAIYDAPEPNAFATGWNRNKALVAVSTGLLANMDRDEVEAVLGHEVAHVANGDMVTLALVQGVVNTFVFFLSRVIGHVVDRAVFRVERGYGPGYFITVIVAQIVLGILAMMVVAWFSRWREFRADRGGAQYAGRRKMIAALERLRQVSQPATLPDELEAFGINGARRGLAHLFASHPPLEVRIARLQALRRSYPRVTR